MNVSQQQFNMSTVYPKHHRHPFRSWSGTPSLASDLWQSSNKTRFRPSTSRKSWRYSFDC